jgi:hypothetical protein
LSLATFTELQTAVQSWLNRNVSQLPITDFIDLAEAEATSRVRVRQNMTTAALSLVAGNNYVALPVDCLEEVELNWADSTDPLIRASYNDIDFSRGDTGSRKPVSYAINGSNINFDSVSDGTYSLTLRYYEAWDLATDGTNWLLLSHPDVYLFGALAEANAWLGDTGQAEYSRGRREAAIQRALLADSRTKGAVLRVDSGLVRNGAFDITTG